MDRLRDQSASDDPVVARAAALLASMPPLTADVLRPGRISAAQLSRATSATVVRFAVSGAITLASFAAAAAGAHRAGFFGARHEASAAAAPVATTRAAAPVPVTPEAPTPSAEPARPTPLARPPAADGPRVAEGAEHDESTLIVTAVRALRRQNDPARAESLAEEALRRFPRGKQVEEAMALVIEADAAAGDETGARRAARAYLDRFPRGRFADRARHALGAP